MPGFRLSNRYEPSGLVNAKSETALFRLSVPVKVIGHEAKPRFARVHRPVEVRVYIHVAGNVRVLGAHRPGAAVVGVIKRPSEP